MPRGHGRLPAPALDCGLAQRVRAKLAAAVITLCGLGVWASALSLAETGSGAMLAGLARIFFMRTSGN